jgi:hypothetical protein
METRLSIIFKFFQTRTSWLLRWQEPEFTPLPPEKTWCFIRKQLSYRIFLLFFGFLLGNLFGTFLPLIRIVFPWDGFIVLIIIIGMELINYSRYTSSNQKYLGRFVEAGKKPPIVSSQLWNSDTAASGWNSFKIGFLLGFFIDAYKVGS